MAESGVIEVIDGQVGVCRWGDDERVLAGSLCHDVHLGLPGTEERTGIGRTGEDDIVYIIVGKQRLAGLGFISKHQLHQIRIQALRLEGGAEGFHHELATVNHLRGWLDDDRRAGRQGCRNAAGGNGDGEVPWRSYHGDGVRGELGVRLLQQARGLAVVGAEINRLRDLRVGLSNGLIGLICGHGDELAALGSNLVRDCLEGRGALGGRTLTPLGAELLGAGDVAFYRGWVGDLCDAVFARVALERFLCPLAVRGKSRVSIGLVGKAAGARCLAAILLEAVLGAAGASEGVPALGDGPTERLFLVRKRLLAWGKECVEEVLRCGVLFQAAYQVGHGDIEVFCVDNRGIEDLAAVKDLAHRCLLRWGHALQHLRIHHVQHAALLAQLIGHCCGVEVVGCYTDADAIGVLFAQDEIQ